jgi:hypothetical protein
MDPPVGVDLAPNLDSHSPLQQAARRHPQKPTPQVPSGAEMNGGSSARQGDGFRGQKGRRSNRGRRQLPRTSDSDRTNLASDPSRHDNNSNLAKQRANLVLLVRATMERNSVKNRRVIPQAHSNLNRFLLGHHRLDLLRTKMTSPRL